MDTKQTQGEWKILGDLYTVSDDDGWPVAITALGMRDADECLANARLIAAAPDLLVALKRLSSKANFDGYDDHPEGCGCCIHEALAAIAKATGAA